jgi:hypothetical protein
VLGWIIACATSVQDWSRGSTSCLAHHLATHSGNLYGVGHLVTTTSNSHNGYLCIYIFSWPGAFGRVVVVVYAYQAGSQERASVMLKARVSAPYMDGFRGTKV